jgi:hypothetical protein
VAKLPENARSAWNERQGACVFTTANPDGTPNSIWVSCVKMADEETIVVADNFFDKTRKNLDLNPKVSLLYIAPEKRSFQVKGTVSYQTSGPLYDDMKKGWLDPKLPGRAAAVIQVEAVYSGAEKIA